MKRKGWLILFLILAMGGAAFAGGMTVTGQVRKQDNANAPAGYKVECWDGSISTHPTLPNYASGSGTLSPIPPNNVSTNGSGRLCPAADPATDGFYDPRSNKSVTIRVWEGSDPAAVILSRGYYGYGSYSIGGESAPPAYSQQNIKTDFKADRPDAPTVAAGGYNLTWDDARRQFLVAFTLTASAGTAWKSEGVSYQIRVKKPGADWTAERTRDGASWVITETNLDSPYFVGGGAYVAQAIARNAFGSTTGAEVPFTIPTGGAGGPVTLTFNLKAFDAAKLVVNSISIPPNLKDGAGAAITKASQLIAYIDSLAGSGTVIVLGKWDPTAGKALRLTPAGEGVDFDLTPGEGYQLYVTKDCALTLTGTP